MYVFIRLGAELLSGSSPSQSGDLAWEILHIILISVASTGDRSAAFINDTNLLHYFSRSTSCGSFMN